jgi:acetolactate synthase-1/2/3 large subunit
MVIGVEADVFSAIDALIDPLEALDTRHAAWWIRVREAIAYRPTAWNTAASTVPDRLHPVPALRPLQALLDSSPDSVFISDGGEIGQWAQACQNAPHRVLNGVAGSIGSALPYALAARCAVPHAPVVPVMGDGTFGFHLAEIDTATRYDLGFVAAIGNDARWNAEYQIQLKDYGADRLIGCELRPARYDLVTAAFGGHGELATEAAQVAAAPERAVRSGKAATLNLMIEGLPARN